LHVLVLNAGSSTIKWSVLDGATEERLASGSEDWRPEEAERRIEPILSRAPPFDAVGHRVVHGGSRFRSSVRIDASVVEVLDALAMLDPLHAPPAIAGIRAILSARPNTPNIAAFDTAFHATIPDEAATYAIPSDWTSRYGIRRFGFHGLSVAYSTRILRARLDAEKRPSARIVVCHLGSGASITAVEDGRSIDTTMGFTPLEGLMMATRSGSIDPGIIFHLARTAKMPADAIERALQHESGLFGASGLSGDMREILAAESRGDPRAGLARKMYVESIVRHAGAMIASLGGIDALVFTAGVGEHAAGIRSAVADRLAFAGVEIDRHRNETPGSDRDISAENARARTWVIEAREDLEVLHEVQNLVGASTPA
jgi:acetate kinase